jgi:hypothetical protein
MPPEDLASTGRIRKARSFIGNYLVTLVYISPSLGSSSNKTIMSIDFATTLQSKLSDSPDARTIDLLLADTGHHIQLIHNASQSGSNGSLPSKLAKDVERQGRDLWNLCVRLRRERDATVSAERVKLLVKARSFAFNMLELGRSAGRAKKDDKSETVYLMNLALTLGKVCIGESDLDSARLTLQKAAELMERLKTIPLGSSDLSGQDERTKLDAEYLAMRTALVGIHFGTNV